MAEFKEFERRFKFKPRFKYGWFPLKLYQMFQDKPALNLNRVLADLNRGSNSLNSISGRKKDVVGPNIGEFWGHLWSAEKMVWWAFPPSLNTYYLNDVYTGCDRVAFSWVEISNLQNEVTKGPYTLIFVTETISRTDEGQPRPKYIFNKCGTNIYFFYSTEVWSITITEFLI